MERFTGLIGIVLILGIAFLFSNNKRKINKRLVISGLALQFVIALLVLKVPYVTGIFKKIGGGMQKIEEFSRQGASFVYGGIATDNAVYNLRLVKKDSAIIDGKILYTYYGKQIADTSCKLPFMTQEKNTAKKSYRYVLSEYKQDAKSKKQVISSTIGINFVDGVPKMQSNYSRSGFVFAFNITATIILVCILVAIFYHLGLMQRVVSVISRAMNVVMRVSGAEALSNVASAFVGQVEAQVMIRPYLPTMTKSELLASMAGSMACIAGGILIVYANMGAAAGLDIAPTLIAASLMAAPGALVIAKIIYPETEVSSTMGKVQLKVKSPYTNLVDAISQGAAEGFKISMNVIAMIIGFVALIALINACLGAMNPDLTLDSIFGFIFRPMAWCMGIPSEDVAQAATLLGKKLTINEFVAFSDLTAPGAHAFTEKGRVIVVTAICGFANFASVGMQIGGIGSLVPERRADLAKLGMKALLAGTLASYLSACLAGLLF